MTETGTPLLAREGTASGPAGCAAGVLGAVTVLLETPASGVESIIEIEALMVEASRVRSFAEAALTALAARAEQLAATPEPSGPGGEHLLRRSTRLSASTAAALTRRRLVGDVLPSFPTALATGTITGEHLDAVARVLGRIDPRHQVSFVAAEADLLSSAQRSTPERFAREVRELAEFVTTDHSKTEHERLHDRRSFRWWRRRDGSMAFTGNFGVDGGEMTRILQAAMGALASEGGDTRTREQLTFDALASHLRGGHTQEHPGRPTVIAHVALADLLDPDGVTVGETSDGIRLPLSWWRDHLAEAVIIPVFLDERGIAVEYVTNGRSRLATFAQRAMLRAMHATCMVPGCEVPFDDCEVHHVEAFDGTNTVLPNLGPLCRHHHGRIHRKGWTLQLDSQRTITVLLPDGTVWAQQPFHPPDPPGT